MLLLPPREKRRRTRRPGALKNEAKSRNNSRSRSRIVSSLSIALKPEISATEKCHIAAQIKGEPTPVGHKASKNSLGHKHLDGEFASWLSLMLRCHDVMLFES